MIDFKQVALEWEAGWNSHDLDRIMSHYRSDIVFRSRKAVDLVGSGEIVGKERLRAYWSKALDRQPDLTFRVQSLFEGHDMGVIVYANHRDVLAAETFYFDSDGKIYRAAACHRS